MDKIQKNEQGFGAMEALLILVILGILGFTGYFVWHAKTNANKNLTSSSSTPGTKKMLSKANAQADPYMGWSTYTSKLEGISIKYPANWTVGNNGELLKILNDTATEELFSVIGPVEKLSTGTLLRANITVNVATSGLSAGDCSGLIVHFIKPIIVSGRSLSIVTLDSHTQPGVIIGMYVTDEQGLHAGDTTSICQPSFASAKENSNVFVSATFSRPPRAGDHADGANIELTDAEYNQSLTVQQELKVLESLSY